MKPLRKKMIDEMTLRGFSPKTHAAYVGVGEQNIAGHFMQHVGCSCR